MDLNHIELPAIVIADLYHSSLVGKEGIVSTKKDKPEIPDQHTNILAEKPAAIANWHSLGDNQKKILIIVNSDEGQVVPEKDLQFLTGILGACKLTIADVVIVNIHDQPTDYKTLANHFESRIVFLFNVDPVSFGLPINFPHYQIQAFAGNSFIYAPSLKALENDKLEKSKLWVSLKRLLNL